MTRGERNIAWIEAMCRIPEGRFVGQRVRLRDWQRAIIGGIYDNPHGTRRAIVSFGRKNAKALALDTPIPTPRGWRTIEEIEPGDEVFGANGRACRVLAVSEVFVGKPCYRVGFSDGSSVVASGDHLWTTTHAYRPWAAPRVNGSGNGGRWRTETVTTEQIAQSVRRCRRDGGVEFNHKIACAPALETEPVELPVPPYVLGAWLGDGTSACASITVGEKDLAELSAALSAEGVPFRARKNEGRATTLILAGGSRSDCIQARLRRLGVLGAKHIPARYLEAGLEQRWALLQGLMDTDGTVNRCGGKATARCSFSSTNERLARDVWRLARSLGLKASIHSGTARLNGRNVGIYWRVAFAASTADPVFRLERKQRLLPKTLSKRSRTLVITSCEPVESVPTKCLMVDAPDALFLVGHGCVPTHNTTLSAFLLLLHLCGPEARANSQLFSAAQSRDQAAILFALAAKVVRLSPELRQYVVVRDTAKQLFCPELGTLYRALSAEASTAYGLSPVFTVHDELGQVTGPRSELYEALETAAGAQDEPLSIIISTQAPTDADLLSILIDDAKTGADPKVKLFLYTADESLDPFSDEAILAANPAFGDFLNADEVRDQARSAQRMPAREAAYRNLVLNQRVNMTSPFIARAVWEACRGEPDEEVFRRMPVYGGLDLSGRNDLTALVLVAQDEQGVWHVKPEFWAPQVGIADRAHRDRAPYDLWAQQGYLHTTAGASVDFDFIARHIADLSSNMDLRAIAFDRWRMDYLTAAFDDLGLRYTVKQKPDDQLIGDGLILVKHGQGYQDMPPALDALEAELLNHRVRHGGHPVLTWCAANAVAERNAAGERKLEKAKSIGRIDGIVALAMAIRCLSVFGVCDPNSIYEDRGLLIA